MSRAGWGGWVKAVLAAAVALATVAAGGLGAPGGPRAEAAPHPAYAARAAARAKKAKRATRRKGTARRKGSARRKNSTRRGKASVKQRRAGRGTRSTRARSTKRRSAKRQATKRRTTKRRAAKRQTAKRSVKRGSKRAGKRSAKRRTKRAAQRTIKRTIKPAPAPSKPLAPGTPVEPELLLVTARAMEEGRIVARQPWDCVPDRLKAVLGQVAERWGPVTINSTHRSRRHNRRVGGRPRSFHLRCQAVDFRVNAPTPGLVAWLRQHPMVGGYKRYHSGYFHIDTGPRRTW